LEEHQERKGPHGEREEEWPDLVWEMKEVQERERRARMDSLQAKSSQEREKERDVYGQTHYYLPHDHTHPQGHQNPNLSHQGEEC